MFEAGPQVRLGLGDGGNPSHNAMTEAKTEDRWSMVIVCFNTHENYVEVMKMRVPVSWGQR
jgi:hypothetical protein